MLYWEPWIVGLLGMSATRTALDLRGLRPHPLPSPLRESLRQRWVWRSPSGVLREGVEKLKEAGGLRPPASLKTLPLPRLGALAPTPYFAGGGVGVRVQSDAGTLRAG